MLVKPELPSKIKGDIQKWWGDLWQQLYAANDAVVTPENYARQLRDLEDMFRGMEHMPGREMALDSLEGKQVLEIGSGAGGHSALFKSYGANMTSVDLTWQRARSTGQKLALVQQGSGVAYQADAENLPFRDNSFDIVYSNGVLHHSENTDRCLDEVLRVLKPGGRAVIMLYARHSAVYWCNIVPRAVVSGDIFRYPEAEWSGRATEGKPQFGTTKNPVTRIYSYQELQTAFAKYTDLKARKFSFEFDNFAIPRLTQFRYALLKALGCKTHPGGIPVYGFEKMLPRKWELFLGRYIGFGWAITARKAE
ncbi:MAG: class I SAM-dependent methyltransferase [Magnetospirillum gryphiswaldense]|nr:class I SAM-dependent methyltransferase [Magnetospirillum gryphiswaldense]